MKPEDAGKILAYSPMLHSRLMIEDVKYRNKKFQPTKAGLQDVPEFGKESEERLDGRRDVDRPLTVQFCANDPDVLLQAAKYVQPYCDAVDLNLGCPQGIAKSGHYGSFLQEDQDLIFRLIRILRDNLEVPVTAKIRILETKEKTLAYAKRVLEAGASILTVHGRQRYQKGHETGLADWSVIRYLRENLPTETVLFANGNILRHEDIAKCLKATGADGVMSAEGNLYDPTIFGPHPPEQVNDREYFQCRDGRGGYRMDFVFRRYMSLIYKYVLEIPEPERQPLFSISDPHDRTTKRSREDSITTPPPEKRRKLDSTKRKEKSKNKVKKVSDPNLGAMQPHLFHMLRPLVSVHTDVRDTLARCHAGNIEGFEEVLRLTEAAVKQGILEYEADPGKFEDSEPLTDEDTALNDTESSIRTIRLCKRPWFVCQSYIRPLPKEAIEKGSLLVSKKELKKRKMEQESKMVQQSSVNIDGGNDLEKEQVPSSTRVFG